LPDRQFYAKLPELKRAQFGGQMNISEWLTWGQNHSAILSLIGSMVIAIGTIAAAVITARRYLSIYQTHVAMEFFRRYAEISQRMPDRLRLSKLSSAALALPATIDNQEMALIARSMIEYGNLCCEEFALQAQGRIPTEIWETWKEGIAENFETAVWRDAWKLVAVEYRSYETFSAFMDRLIMDAEAIETARSAT
jgi:hypothetical protein